MKSDVVICLPARYQSTRLPGKPLIEISGKPLIIWALESAAKINVKQMVVATDDQRIFNLVEKSGYEVVMTKKEHQSGTDRIAQAVLEISCDFVVNVQGDEPMASISTLYQRIESFIDLINPNNVKLVTDENDCALYFSRSAIPFSREFFPKEKLDNDIIYKHHIGLYAYRAGFLKRFSELQASDIENTESLEQLRAMSYGHKIVTKLAQKSMPHGIDTPEDILNFEQSIK